jgi:hypothetical protein
VTDFEMAIHEGRIAKAAAYGSGEKAENLK